MNRAEKRRQKKLSKKAARGAPNQKSLDSQQIIDLAMQHHNAGRLSEAEDLYCDLMSLDWFDDD